MPVQVPCTHCENGQVTSHTVYNPHTHETEAVNVTCGTCNGSGMRQV